jgi:hypothetical protein
MVTSCINIDIIIDGDVIVAVMIAISRTVIRGPVHTIASAIPSPIIGRSVWRKISGRAKPSAIAESKIHPT